MNVAILILVHKNLIQLNELLRVLDNTFNLYIHVDRKSNIELGDIIPSSKHRITKNYPVYWGSYNQILATYSLMKAAFLDDNDFFLLISGQDFPIKSNSYIIDFIESNKSNDFIEYECLPRNHWQDNGGLERIAYFWENRDESSLLSYIFRQVRKYQRSHKFLQRKMDLSFFGGTNWFNLSKSTMQKIIEYVDKNSYLDRFKYTRCADEIWLQTLLISKLQQTSLINDSLRYIDWHSGPEYPRTLRTADLEMIRNSPALFARKFDLDIDPHIIRSLTAEL